MLTLAQYLDETGEGPTGFAKRLATLLRRKVSPQNVWRWTRTPKHADYSIPDDDYIAAIEVVSDGKVPAQIWHRPKVQELSRRVVRR